MIFVTVGTNEQPFDRLVAAAEALDLGEPVIAQYGSSRLERIPEHWVDYLPFDEMAQMMRAARCVVAHAGVGSILLAHRCGKRPIVMPRRHRLGEAVDDHQVGLAQRLAALGQLATVDDAAALSRELAGDVIPLERSRSHRAAPSALAGELRGYLQGRVRVRETAAAEVPAPAAGRRRAA